MLAAQLRCRGNARHCDVASDRAQAPAPACSKSKPFHIKFVGLQTSGMQLPSFLVLLAPQGGNDRLGHD